MKLVTEPEARTKWCPQVRVGLPVAHGGVNRISQEFKNWAEGKDREFMQRQEDACKCIAQDCALWVGEPRTTVQKVDVRPLGEGWEKDGDPFKDEDWAGSAMFQRWKRLVGRCGLINQPHVSEAS